MEAPLEVKIRALTPIWTGGANRQSDRLHLTGIIGSLRWWYEVIVRGLGGYACDPTDGGCKLEGNEKNEKERKEKMCPVCYLFGCTGWKRQFQLQVEEASQVPLHFRTSLDINKGWLKRIFVAENQSLDRLMVVYGSVNLRLIIDGNDNEKDFIQSQLAMLFEFIASYGGLGAKLQYGFGQINMPGTSMTKVILGKVIELKTRLTEFKPGKNPEGPFNLNNFISMEYELSENKFATFLKPESHLGNRSLIEEKNYIPCVFDLRYKGDGDWGMRKWLKEIKGWKESNDADKWGQIDRLLGTRSKWKVGNETKFIKNEKRLASRLCFGMPHRLPNGNYRLRIYGFAPPDIHISGRKMSPEFLREICQDYIKAIFGKESSPISIQFGKDIAALSGGGFK